MIRCAEAGQGKNPHIHDVGCICHLSDLVVKSGMKGLPIDIDQLFIDVFYTIAVRECRSLMRYVHHRARCDSETLSYSLVESSQMYWKVFGTA